jgi:hypothetical protein
LKSTKTLLYSRSLAIIHPGIFSFIKACAKILPTVIIQVRLRVGGMGNFFLEIDRISWETSFLNLGPRFF